MKPSCTTSSTAWRSPFRTASATASARRQLHAGIRALECPFVPSSTAFDQLDRHGGSVEADWWHSSIKQSLQGVGVEPDTIAWPTVFTARPTIGEAESACGTMTQKISCWLIRRGSLHAAEELRDRHACPCPIFPALLPAHAGTGTRAASRGTRHPGQSPATGDGAILSGLVERRRWLARVRIPMTTAASRSPSVGPGCRGP